jgi:hypothetical protein
VQRALVLVFFTEVFFVIAAHEKVAALHKSHLYVRLVLAKTMDGGEQKGK